jgi:hypothetical protein
MCGRRMDPGFRSCCRAVILCLLRGSCHLSLSGHWARLQWTTSWKPLSGSCTNFRHLGRGDDSLPIWKYPRSGKLRIEWRRLFALFSGIGELETRYRADCSLGTTGLELVAVTCCRDWTTRPEKTTSFCANIVVDQSTHHNPT